MKTNPLTLLAIATALVSGCSPKSESNAAPAPAKATAAATYPLRGVILEVQPAQSAVMVKHEDIPGFMPAMTMLFKVDAATLKTATKDQTITATLFKQGDDFWLRNLEPVPHAKK